MVRVVGSLETKKPVGGRRALTRAKHNDRPAIMSIARGALGLAAIDEGSYSPATWNGVALHGPSVPDAAPETWAFGEERNHVQAAPALDRRVLGMHFCTGCCCRTNTL